jgi:hypothetical protein
VSFSLGSLGKLFDPGAVVHTVVDASLPEDMQWVGGVAGAIVDLGSGNDLGALAQTLSALSDLQDLPQSPTPNKETPTGGTAPTAPALTKSDPQWSYEPSPPPHLTTTTTTTSTTTTSSDGSTSNQQAGVMLKRLQDYLEQRMSPPKAPAQPAPPKPAAAPTSQVAGWRGAPASWAAKATTPATVTTTTTTTTTVTGNAPATPPPTSQPTGASLPSSSTTKGAGTPSAKPSDVDPSTLSKDNFMKLSDDDFMKAIRDGKIPSEVTDSQAGMLALQARMNHISEMNQMMTTMMQSMHQMKMSVVENLKV